MELEGWIEWHVSTRTHPGEAVCGDAWLALQRPAGLLLAVVDGLGHGEGAAEAARVACDVLRESSEGPLDVLVTRCHAALRGTRGVALTLALVRRAGRLDWLGVGNVEAVIARASGANAARVESLMLQPGIVGYALPTLRPAEIDFSPGDMLVMATDGVRSSFLEALSAREDPSSMAPQLLARYGKQTDDALVLAATCLRGGA